MDILVTASNRFITSITTFTDIKNRVVSLQIMYTFINWWTQF